MTYTSLISPEDLTRNLNNPNWRIIDCRFDLNNRHAGFEKYNAGHISNALYADLKNDLSSPETATSGRHPLPAVPEITKRLGAWGIDSKTQVVVYDDACGSFAGRLWWILNWLGHERVAVLNGGLNYWEQNNYPTTKDLPQIQPANFIANPDMSMVVDTTRLEQLLASSNILLIDVRDPQRYQGLLEPIDKIAGHVPGAVNVPWKSNIDENGLYLTPPQLSSIYKNLIKDNTDKDVVFMCGSGVTACHSLVAMKYLGYEGAKLYPGSWSEWIQDPHHPIETIQS